jgi:hypothetical protein
MGAYSSSLGRVGNKNDAHVLTDIICATAGVEKNDDNAKHNFYSSNRHDPCGEVLRTEKRLEKLDDACRREKRAYAKQNQQYWSGGISTQRAAKRARSTGDS